MSRRKSCGPTTRPLRLTRRGVSLLEVLFAIGVMVVGLLGAAALLPIAADQVRKGNNLDQGAAVGQQATQDFMAHGMANINNWWTFNPGLSLVTAVNTRQSFCIDPRFVIDNDPSNPTVQVVLPPSYASSPYDPTLFPFYTITNPSEARMQRISLVQAPFALPRLPMTRIQADQVFVSHDRLLVSRPTDKTLPATPVIGWGPGTDGAWGAASTDDDGNGRTDDGSEAGGGDDLVAYRSAEDDVSWLATLVPHVQGSDFAGATLSGDDTYTLSIVVFRNRSGSLLMNSGAPSPPDETTREQLALVDTFGSAGVNGGDVRLQVPLAQKEQLAALKEGDYVMLSGKMVDQPFVHSNTPTLVNYFAWYKVVATEAEIDSDATNAYRYISLLGRDWTRPEWLTFAQPTQAVLVPGVISVYERTVRLEATSLWN